MKIGIPKEYFIDGMNPEVKAAVDQGIHTLKELGAEIIEVSLPHTEHAIAVYYILTPSEVSSNLGRYDGMRFGYSASHDEEVKGEIKNVIDGFLQSRGRGLGDEAKRRIMLGTYALSSGYYDAYYKKASAVRTLIKQDFDEAFKQVDLIVAPVTPKVAFKLGAQDEDPLQMYLEDVLVAPASLAGVPAMSIPCGFAAPKDNDKLQLPVGLQLIAPQFEESKLLSVGNLFQKQTKWHTELPPM